ncbi:nucleolar transcription factor 1-like isoform X2 [Boleophthalmus pectinirostris]|uniref:nucleolar transcription factor 1-like isoform X2 n=1 Tax=Boleophthalmus pectinirostris TaxID=150288 RepID=UPI00243214CF|nr:nucleolar transcription factor 1-like isoform X2 [Boleophthalmus pectinirostris]
MAACTRIIVLLIILLQFLESEQILYECVAEGEDATLPCEKVEPEQKQCDETTWTFEETNPRQELVRSGKVKSERMNLTEKCSLQIKVKKSTHTSETELSCSISSKERCVRFRSKWSIGDVPVEESHPHLAVKTSNCLATVKVPTSELNNLRLQEFTCDVKCTNNEIKFHFPKNSPESLTGKEESREDDSEDSEDSEEDRSDIGFTEEDDKEDGSEETLNSSEEDRPDTGLKVKAKEANNTPTGEEEPSYASINFGVNHKKTAVRSSEEAVTYSSVRIAPSDPAQRQDSDHKHKQK